MTDLEIQQACERLLSDYAWTQDNGDPQAFADLFAPDGIWVRPARTLIGRQAILENAQETFLKTPQEKALHYVCNFRLDIDHEGAGSTSYSIAFHGEDDGSGYSRDSLPVAGMIYRDRFRLVGGAWRISRHETEFRFKR